MRTRRSIRLACLLAVAIASSAPAKPTPAQRCAAAKLKAAAVKIDRKLACHRAAVLAGRPVATACLLSAETKFGRAVAKAESTGGCTVTGDLGCAGFGYRRYAGRAEWRTQRCNRGDHGSGSGNRHDNCVSASELPRFEN